ncbi:MAG: hypothetical protein IJJ78_02805 [Paludibacteraceae bacterium]|nr:hypothetical protein [Paludibacteraceae bacterium]
MIFTAIESKKGDRQQERIKKQLEKKTTIIDKEKGIKITWDVAMPSIYNPNPHPCNINVFCTKHEMPLLMQNGGCLDSSCPNACLCYDEDAIKTYIESILLNEQERLNSKNK